jgi:N-acetyl-1-D-myo-inositol-2-amino-2-deoxy-alpha-D-glucopyranoside deacetylase
VAGRGGAPDDESFGCGSTIDHAAALGAEVTGVCATSGEAGESTPGSPHGEDLGSVREEELRRAAARLGVGRVELLGYRDSGVDGDPPAGSLRAAPVSEVADAVSRLLRELRAPLLVEHCLPNGLLRRWLEEIQVLRPGTAYHSLDPATLGRDDAAIIDVLDTTGVPDAGWRPWPSTAPRRPRSTGSARAPSGLPGDRPPSRQSTSPAT